MGHDPNEKPLAKVVAAPSGDAIGTYRLQGPVVGRDEIHIHDDANHLVFIWQGGRSLRLAWQQFLGKCGMIGEGETLAFIGEGNPSLSRKKAAMVFTNVHGNLEMSIQDHGPWTHEIRKNKMMEDLDDWIERSC